MTPASMFAPFVTPALTTDYFLLQRLATRLHMHINTLSTPACH